VGFESSRPPNLKMFRLASQNLEAHGNQQDANEAVSLYYARRERNCQDEVFGRHRSDIRDPVGA